MPECWEHFRLVRNLYFREVLKAKKEFLKQTNDALQNEIKSLERFYQPHVKTPFLFLQLKMGI